MTCFRFTAEFISDPKIGRMPDLYQLVLVKLMCLESKGDLDPSYSFEFDQDLAAALRVDDKKWEEIRDVFLAKKLIEKRGNGYTVIYGGGIKKEGSRPPQKEWAALRSTVFERDDYTCQYCGVRGVSLQCDHVIPVSRGGSNELSNLVAACAKCNLSKHDKTPEEWLGVHQ